MFKPPKDLLDFVFSIPDTKSFKGSGKHLTWSLKRIGEEKREHRIIDNNAGSDEVKLILKASNFILECLLSVGIKQFDGDANNSLNQI